MFTNSENLTREDIDTYRETSDEKVKQLIEEKSLGSDFDSDALEGWANSSIGTKRMKLIDDNFIGKGRNLNLKIISGIIVFTILITFFLLYNNSTYIKSKKVNSTQGSVIYEKTDIITPDEIELMVEIPIKEQIKITTIQKDFKIQKTDEISSNEVKEPIIVDRIETSKIVQQKNDAIQSEIELAKNQSLGKEIYLVEMKLVDYRLYRSKPTVKTKTIELNNTPASQEDKFSKEEDVSNWRVTEIPYIEYIEKTMSLFSKGNYKKALSRFEIILESYPKDINANFYGGLCYFNLGEFEKAIQTFETSIESEFSNFNEESEWYLAKSYSANGQEDKASSLFKKINKNGGYYSKQALKYLK